MPPSFDQPADPEFAQAAGLQESGAFAEAAEVWDRLAKRGLTLNIAVNLGVCQMETGRFSEAEPWLALAVRNQPRSAQLRHMLGNLYAEMGEIERAEAEYRTGLGLEPQNPRIRLSLAGLLLSVGRYREGWPMLEARVGLNPDVVPPVAASFPEWKGEPLTGRSILVWYEQGFGDQIQFARFAQGLKARGAAHVALGCRPPLTALLATAPGVDEVIAVPRGGQVAIRPYDCWSRYFSLPGHLQLTLETVPSAPYLTAPAERRERWAPGPGAPRIGMAWRASPTGFNAAHKNVPDALARRVLDLGARSLHPEDTGATDFADTAALIESLDLVISIDTSVAHLAGAMGKPCWTLLPGVHTDWRWLRGRHDSPWYPTMRLYRQPAPGDWPAVLDEVVRDLETQR